MSDTIVAIATPPGRGGIGVVRISGPAAAQLAARLIGEVPAPRRAQLARFADADGQSIDEGLAVFFPAPHSYTGEHVLELHGHGGPVVLEALVTRAIELGARRAAPGEFTQRAFLNDKLDLTQAEAIADLIDAGSRQSARAALRSLQGEFAAQVRRLAEHLTDLRAYVEASLDFPEEEIDFLSDPELEQRLQAVSERFDAVEASARQGRLLREGMTLVIAGRPNAGKSTLLNRLAGYDAAIVTPFPGTTRDILRERIDIDGLPLHVLDTAGLRSPVDAIEAEGIRRAHTEITRADRILFVIDAQADPHGRAFEAERHRFPPGIPITVVFNKCDLAQPAPPANLPAPILLSAHTGAGMAALRTHLTSAAGYQAPEGGAISARQRHLEALQSARQHLDAAARELREHRARELVAHELGAAQRDLGEITGQVSSDDLLGRIFATFCIGK
jgi:tRNA modification GTPase